MEFFGTSRLIAWQTHPITVLSRAIPAVFLRGFVGHAAAHCTRDNMQRRIRESVASNGASVLVTSISGALRGQRRRRGRNRRCSRNQAGEQFRSRIECPRIGLFRVKLRIENTSPRSAPWSSPNKGHVTNFATHVLISGARRGITPSLAKLLRRRSAIEPEIGHMEATGG